MGAKKKKIFLRQYNNSKMEIYKYIVIDDEYPSHLVVKYQFKRYSNYECVGLYFDPSEALKFVENHEVDLIFLDIEMPKMNGFQFIEALKKRVFVVFLTAFEEKYSLKAHEFFYDKDLVIFTNKSQFSFNLPKIITRFEKMYAEKVVINRVNQLTKNNIDTFPKKVKKNFIQLQDIVYIMIVGHNAILKMKCGEEHIFRMSLLELLSFLPVDTFLRVNRNIIIHVRYVTALTEFTVCVGDKHFFISTRRRKEVVPILQTYVKKMVNNY